MIDLLCLRCNRADPTANDNDAVLFQSIVLPNLFRGGILLQGAHDVNMVGGRVDDGQGWDEYVIASGDRCSCFFL